MLNHLKWITPLCCLGSMSGVVSGQEVPTGTLSFQDKLEIWQAIWHSASSEVALVALLLLVLGLSLVAYLWRTNHRLRQLTQLHDRFAGFYSGRSGGSLHPYVAQPGGS